jgi:hypothetical protein
MAHTPGPWYCHFAAAVGEQSEGGYYSDAIGITTKSEAEFLVDGDRGGLVAYVPFDEDHHANARLIATAPELLRIVQDMALAIEGEGEFAMWDEGWQDNYRAAKAAIAKVTGGEG